MSGVDESDSACSDTMWIKGGGKGSKRHAGHAASVWSSALSIARGIQDGNEVLAVSTTHQHTSLM
jgi:hypothetical protein